MSIRGFCPFVNGDSKILILGSFPSVKSREENFYYGNKQNRFWRTLAQIFGEKLPTTVEEKKSMLLKTQRRPLGRRSGMRNRRLARRGHKKRRRMRHDSDFQNGCRKADNTERWGGEKIFQKSISQPYVDNRLPAFHVTGKYQIRF